MNRKTLVFGSLGFFGFLFILWPLPQKLQHLDTTPTTRILDRSGALLYEVRSPSYGLTHPINLEEMPKAFTQAVIATEDRSFALHPGISLRGIARAFVQNIEAGRIVSGGSTITQQLVRTRINPEHRGFLWKLAEMFLALKLELFTSKDQILSAYLNSAYFGHQAYGIAAAAKTYFGKSVQELSTAESAFLAGLLQSPVALDPFEHFKEAKERQQRVIQAMEETGIITQPDAEEAQSEPLTLARDAVSIRAPHFVMWLLNTEALSLSKTLSGVEGRKGRGLGEGEGIRTTIDLNLQTEIERIVEQKLEKLRDKNVTSAAVVVIDAHTGDVLSMVGSADYFDAEHDGAVNVAIAPRQPGSAMKPFTYALALMKGETAATTVADTEAQFFTQEGNPYIPRNYDYGYHGLVRYREALANSYNIAAVKVLERVSVPALLTFLRHIGVTSLTETPEHYGLALTLGDAEVSLLELTRAYAIFPRAGQTLPLRIFMHDPAPLQGKDAGQVLDPRVAWLINDILSDKEARLPEFSDQGPLNFDFPVAAKTGTTRNSRDNWTIGFTPDVLVGVWVGNADNSPMKGTSGITGAGPIFHDVMLAATRNRPHHGFERPADIIDQEICRLSGKLPTPLCPHTLIEHFIAGTEPHEPDDLFKAFSIDRRNGLLANSSCPSNVIIQKTFAVFPRDVQKWAHENGWEQPPSTTSTLCTSNKPADAASQSSAGKPVNVRATSWIEITKPQPGDSYKLDPLIPDKDEKIIFEALASDGISSTDWYVDGKKVGTGKRPDFRFVWRPTVGRFIIEARREAAIDRATIEILK